MRKIFAVLWLLALAPGWSLGTAKSERLILAPLHVRLAALKGWDLYDGRAEQGWVSFYWKRASDPAESAIDVFYYAKSEPQGSPEGYLRSLRAPGQAPLGTRHENWAGRQAWLATRDFTSTLHAYTLKARSQTLRETHLVLEHPEGIVVLRLQSTPRLHETQEKTLRALASSVEPL